MTWFLTRILVVLNLAAFVAVGVDKFLAQRGKRRIPEAQLLTFSAFGMAPGLWLGMIFFRHKTKKPSFLVGAVVALLASIGVYALVWYLNT